MAKAAVRGLSAERHKYSFSNMYVQPRSGRSLANSVWDGGVALQATSSS